MGRLFRRQARRQRNLHRIQLTLFSGLEIASLLYHNTFSINLPILYNQHVDTTFLLKLVLSFLIGGLWIIVATIVADKLGSKIGGLISGLPSTIMFSLFFIGWTQGPAVAVQATTIAPIIAGVTGVFLACYVFLVKRNFWLSIIISLGVWLTLSSILVWIHFNNFLFSLIDYLLLVVANFLVMEKVLKIQSIKGKKVKYTKLIILSRGVVGGFVVALAVFLGKIGGPILGGTFSMFPAMFIGL